MIRYRFTTSYRKAVSVMSTLHPELIELADPYIFYFHLLPLLLTVQFHNIDKKMIRKTLPDYIHNYTRFPKYSAYPTKSHLPPPRDFFCLFRKSIIKSTAENPLSSSNFSRFLLYHASPSVVKKMFFAPIIFPSFLVSPINLVL